MFQQRPPRPWATLRNVAGLWLAALAWCPANLQAQAPPNFQGAPQAVVFKLRNANSRLEMIANSSRVLMLDNHKIPQLQVSNPEVVRITPISPNEVQVFALKAGVTQVNVWDENKQVYTIDVIVLGDARELAMHLQALFPKAAIRVVPLANSAVIAGHVDDPTQVNTIIRIAEDFYPNIINAITVGNVQQVLLKVKVYEVSRTKLRNLGFDFAQITSNGSVYSSAVSGLLTTAGTPGNLVTTGTDTFITSVLGAGNQFIGVLEALRQDDLAKILAEPNVVTVSGRPAYFNAGGEFPVLVPQSLGTVSIQYRPYGTQVDFVPIVLGNGRIRLEVRPRVSEIDAARSVTVNGLTVPALKVREIDTGVEMQAGQTLAIGGLVQNRIEAQSRGIPGLKELPFVGAFFRRQHEQTNEVELLIMVTPELIEASDAHEMPRCLPGQSTTTPTDMQFYIRGHIEVPKLCPPGEGGPMGAHPTPLPGADSTWGEQVPTPLPAAPNPPPAPPVRPGPPAPILNAPPVPTSAASTKPGSGVRVMPQAPRERLPAVDAEDASLTEQKPIPLPPVHASAATAATETSPGFFGPVGYDGDR